MFMHNFIQKVPRDRASFTVFQNLNLGNASANPKWHILGYILSISMCMQSFITIVHSVRPFSLFQNLELGTASTDVNCHFAISWARLFHSFQEIAQFSLFQNLALLVKPRPMINIILQFLALDLFNIKLSANFYQNIPNGLRVNFHLFFRIWTSTTPKCHLTISWATSCQYTNVYAKFHHNIPLSSRDRAIFTFSEFGTRQNLDRWKMTFHNLLGLILIISLFKQKFIKIFHSVQEIRSFAFFFSEIGARQSLDRW